MIPTLVEPSNVERSLDASIKDGAAYAVMVGLGETYVGVCAVFLGASASAVGLLVTVSLFLGACTQLLSAREVERRGRRKTAMLAGATGQMLSWIPMTAALFVPKPWGFWLLFIGFALYFVTNHYTVPAWYSMLGDLVPADRRGRFFGNRSAIAITMQFLATLAGGAGLAVYEKAGHEVWGFVVVFSGALLARGASVYYLTRMTEPQYTPRPEDHFTLWQFLARFRASNFAKFVVFVACLNAATYFAGAMFTPYFRDTLRYSYVEFSVVTILAVVIQIPALPFWGRMADRHGNRRVLLVTSLGVAILPGLFLLTTSVVWACLFQLVSGTCWSGFNQSVVNFLLDAVTPGKRARCAAYLNLLTNCGVLAGGLAGAVVMNMAPVDLWIVRMPYPFWTLLLISCLLRLSTVAVFIPRFREVREVPRVGLVQMLYQATREAAEAAVSTVLGFGSRSDDRQGTGPASPS